jgi:hypothetical protein
MHEVIPGQTVAINIYFFMFIYFFYHNIMLKQTASKDRVGGWPSSCSATGSHTAAATARVYSDASS